MVVARAVRDEKVGGLLPYESRQPRTELKVWLDLAIRVSEHIVAFHAKHLRGCLGLAIATRRKLVRAHPLVSLVAVAARDEYRLAPRPGNLVGDRAGLEIGIVRMCADKHHLERQPEVVLGKRRETRIPPRIVARLSEDGLAVEDGLGGRRLCGRQPRSGKGRSPKKIATIQFHAIQVPFLLFRA